MGIRQDQVPHGHQITNQGPLEAMKKGYSTKSIIPSADLEDYINPDTGKKSWRPNMPSKIRPRELTESLADAFNNRSDKVEECTRNIKLFERVKRRINDIKSLQRQGPLERRHLKLRREPSTRPGLPRNSTPSLPRYSPSRSTFPSTPSRKFFKTPSPKLTSSRKSTPGLPQPQSKPPYTSPPLLPPQDSTSYHPDSSDLPGPAPSDS